MKNQDKNKDLDLNKNKQAPDTKKQDRERGGAGDLSSGKDRGDKPMKSEERTPNLNQSDRNQSQSDKRK